MTIVLPKGRFNPYKMATDCAYTQWQPRFRWFGPGTYPTRIHNPQKAQPYIKTNVPHDNSNGSSDDNTIVKEKIRPEEGPTKPLHDVITTKADATTDDNDYSNMDNDVNLNAIVDEIITEVDDYDNLSDDTEEEQDNKQSWIAATRSHTSPADAITSCPVKIKDCSYTGTALFSPLNQDNDYTTL